MRSLLLALLLATGVTAATAAPTLTPDQRYVHFRAAVAAGELDKASEQMNALLAATSDSAVLTEHAYRQGIVAGDHDLAVRAARLLDAQKTLPPDGPLLFAVDAIRARDWKAARLAVDRLSDGRLFAFTVPLLHAWIAVGAGDASPTDTLEIARTAGLASTYYPAERVLILAAMGRLDDAARELKAQQSAGSRLKMLVASAFLKANRPAEALALLAGDEDALVDARARLRAGKPLGLMLDGPAAGVSELFSQIAVDFNRQRILPVAVMMARFATFADPRNSGAWIATASLLGADKKQPAAIAALRHVDAGDPYADEAETLRVSLLIDAGDKDGALRQALAGTRDGHVGAGDWARVGDVYLALDRNAEAAAAYAKAVDLARALPAEQQWPILLQWGTALDLAGDWPGAKAALVRAAELAPAQPAVLNHLGYSLLSRREDIAHARVLIEQASRLRPDDPAIIDSSGWAHFVGGDIRGALLLLETAAASEPGDPTINEHLGDAYWTAGRRIEARYAWRAAEIGAEQKDLARLQTKLADGLTRATASP